MSSVADRLAPLYLALALDLSLGDPPNRFHPTAWIGHAIGAADRFAPRGNRSIEFVLGAATAIAGMVLAFAAGLAIERGLFPLSPWMAWPIKALALKSAISARGLARAACLVQSALERGDLPEARALLGRHLVSRDPSNLSREQAAAATIESVAENAGDALVAPLAFYLVAGLPGALAYRFLNTADAMLGYHTPAYEWFGKASARLDDLANWIPARITAFLMVLAAPMVGGDSSRAWRIWRRDARLTSSPNAGQPMSVAAGALGIELEKVGAYRLGAGLSPAKPGDIGRSVRLVAGAVGIALAAIAFFAFLRNQGMIRPS